MSALNDKLKGIRRSAYKTKEHSFEVDYELGYGFKDGVEPFFLVNYKVFHNGKRVLESRNGSLSWVVPKGIEPLSDLMFILMMDSLTNELLVDLRIEEESRRGKKGVEKVKLLSSYREHCHVWWNHLCDKYPDTIKLLEQTYLPNTDNT